MRVNKYSPKVIVSQRSRHRYRPASIQREVSSYIKEVTLNEEKAQVDDKKRLNSYLNGLEAYLNSSLKGTPREFQFSADGTLCKESASKRCTAIPAELASDVLGKEDLQARHKKSQSVVTHRDSVEIQTESRPLIRCTKIKKQAKPSNKYNYNHRSA